MVTDLRAVVRGWHRPMLGFAGVMAAMTVVCLVALVVDRRELLGAPIWAKPLKFAISMTVYCLAWSWLYALLARGRRLAWLASTAIVLFLAVEYAVIIGQVLRGRPSHFNMSTPLDSALWTTMAMTIAALWLATLLLTTQVLLAPIADTASRWAIRLGALISLVGLALGALMTTVPAQNRPRAVGPFTKMVGAHSVGVPDGGPGLPLLGWSTTGGDLRIPHFVGMHALQALPLLALLLEVLARRVPALRPPARRARLVITASVGYAGLVALVTWQAERGQPLLRPDALTLAGLGALVGVVLGVGGWLLRRPVAPERPEQRLTEVSA